MSQHDFNIANQTFPSFRADLNDALQAAATISAGATAPTTPYAYQLWYDTANEKYMIRNAANSAWLNFVGIDTNGNVDVTGQIDVNSAARIDSSGIVKAANGTEAAPTHSFLNDPDNGMFRPTTNTIGFSTAGSEAARIDSSGNLLVGKLAANSATVGFETKPTGFTAATRDGLNVLVLNRLTSDGDIVSFRKDSTVVGSIQSRSGLVSTIILDPRTAGNGGVGITGTGNTNNPAILPTDETGTVANNNTNLGDPAQRFKDLWLSGGVYLGGTGSANYLDHYEEGTWNPTSFSGWSVNPTLNSARYTRIGRLVILSIYFASGTSNADARFTNGLPFAADGEGHTGAGVSGSINDVGNVMVNGASTWFTNDGGNFANTRFTAVYLTSA